jgi:hypothetical protein
MIMFLPFAFLKLDLPTDLTVGVNLALRGPVAQVNDDHIPFFILKPALGHQILTTRVILPARSLTQTPLASTKNRVIDGLH